MNKIIIALLLVTGLSGCIKDTTAEPDINVVSTQRFSIYKVNASDGTPCYVAMEGSYQGSNASMVCAFNRKP